MSKYLHFGQISPVWLAREARKEKSAGSENIRSFVDELLVRRELTMNFCNINEGYEQLRRASRVGSEVVRQTSTR